MAQLVVRNLDDEVKERLRERAKRNRRSLEAEAREILKEAAESEHTGREAAPGFGTRASARFKRIGFSRKELDSFNRTVEEARKERPRFPKFEP